MKYKIGEFSKLIGMEPSKIRYYERKGVYSNERHENGYREFETNDAYNMNYFRALCCRGYSIKEAIESMDGITLKKAIKDLEEKGQSQEFELLLMEQRKRYIDETLMLLRGVEKNPLDVWQQEIPNYMIHPASKNGDYSFAMRNSEERARWQELVPLTRYVGFGQAESFYENKEEFVDNGEAVRKEEFLALHYPMDETVKECDMGNCICFFAHLDAKESINIKDYPHVENYINSHNLFLKGEFVYFYFMMAINELGNDPGIMCIPVE